MVGDQQTREYIQRAVEAEGCAAIAGDEFLKKKWREIANGYRNLAQARLIFITHSATIEQTPPLPDSQAKYGK